MSMAYEEYMRQLVTPMRQELTQAGFKELGTEEEVTNFMEKAEGTTLVVVNSVCGCAAGLARPAATQSVMNNDKTPDHLVTVFAGQDKEATAKMREYFEGYEPSSPSMAVLKGNKVAHFIPREEIEDHDISSIISNLVTAFNEHC
ncbi:MULTISPECIES: BrxA/BrxB family bacilliredoxin [Bacillaceae]|uniref:BrxA/BrxB family bacilliredoxin n=1 Tax=Bacillaceae TaxID=186817 RepID=UPI001C58F42A|nr:BrxA/BrxB family bacilliredoxin [Rossellomorea sp. YZS02]MBW3113231.1 BrxA/BrxB family bacilliredoxin [Bacillus sp. MCCB 382]MDX8343832.1 BrxA/BrxB family bacilliredoxin [Rossellomorea sp. YZS02]